jgi:hypothetical protein
MTKRILALLASAALAGACNDATGVPDLNNVSAETIAGGLTTASAQLLATGLMNQYRNSAIGNFVVFPETMARDALRIDKAETRYLTELIGNVQPDNGAFTGQGNFGAFFVGIRSANTLIDASVAATDASGLTAANRQALVGIGQTMKALNEWNVIQFRDSIGMPIDLDHDINANPAPFVCKPLVLAYISALLDSGATALAAGGLSCGGRRTCGLPQVQSGHQGAGRALPWSEPTGRHRRRGLQCRDHRAQCVVHAVERFVGVRVVGRRVRKLQHRGGRDAEFPRRRCLASEPSGRRQHSAR